MSVGIRFLNENVAVGVVSPETDSTAEWIYWEEVIASIGGTMHQRDVIHRDIRSQRKSQGLDQELYLQVKNPIGIAGTVFVSGRVLVLIP